jgi:hypothetical protein
MYNYACNHISPAQIYPVLVSFFIDGDNTDTGYRITIVESLYRNSRRRSTLTGNHGNLLSYHDALGRNDENLIIFLHNAQTTNPVILRAALEFNGNNAHSTPSPAGEFSRTHQLAITARSHDQDILLFSFFSVSTNTITIIVATENIHVGNAIAFSESHAIDTAAGPPRRTQLGRFKSSGHAHVGADENIIPVLTLVTPPESIVAF